MQNFFAGSGYIYRFSVYPTFDKVTLICYNKYKCIVRDFLQRNTNNVWRNASGLFLYGKKENQFVTTQFKQTPKTLLQTP